jgi:HrpA-like RNA helicase
VTLSREEIVAARRTTRYRLEYPEALPITAAREELLAAIAAHRVIVVAATRAAARRHSFRSFASRQAAESTA